MKMPIGFENFQPIPTLDQFRALTGRSGVGCIFKTKHDLGKIMSAISKVHAQGMQLNSRFKALRILRCHCIEWLSDNYFAERERKSKKEVERLLDATNREMIYMGNFLFAGEQSSSGLRKPVPPVPKGMVGNAMRAELAMELGERHWGPHLAGKISERYAEYRNMGGRLSIGAYCDHFYMMDREDDKSGLILSVGAAEREITITQGVQYLSEEERQLHVLRIHGGYIYDAQGSPFDTMALRTDSSGWGWGIFVLGFDMKLYASAGLVNRFHHSSFFSGGPVQCGGELSCRAGKLRYVTTMTGHYRSSTRELLTLLKYLGEKKVKLEQTLVAPEIHASENFYQGSVVLDALQQASLQGPWPAGGSTINAKPILRSRPYVLTNIGDPYWPPRFW